MATKPEILTIQPHDHRQMKDSVSTLIDSVSEGANHEDIKTLLEQLEKTLELRDKKDTVKGIVTDLAEEEWSHIEKSMVEAFEFSLAKDKEEFRVRAALDELLNRYIGAESSAKFFEVLGYCIQNKSFASTQRFFKCVDKPSQAIGKVAFAAYRLSAIKFSKQEFMGKRKNLTQSIKDGIEDLHKEPGSVNVDKFVKDIKDAQLT